MFSLRKTMQRLVGIKFSYMRNVPDSSKEDPCNVKEESWINYWKNKAGKEIPSHCSNCNRKDVVEGAHVYKTENNQKWFIIPLCKKCNASTNNKTMCVPDNLLVKVEKFGE